MNETHTAAAAASPTASILEVWMGLFGLTLLVLVVAALLVWYRKLLIKNGAAGDRIQILHVKPLGTRDRILVVRIEDRILVLGQTPSHISLLTELDSFPEDTSGLGTGAFAGQLQKWLASRKTAG